MPESIARICHNLLRNRIHRRVTPTTGKAEHPNKIPFEGILTRLDVASDKAPSGAQGHRVILTREAAEESLDTLENMAVNFASDWAKHDARQKCGVITRAWIEDDALLVAGVLYGRDYPEIQREAAKPGTELGMSYEMCNAHVEDRRATVWKLTRVTFTGAAILLRSTAAYSSTRFNLTAAAETFTGTLVFDSARVKTEPGSRSGSHCSPGPRPRRDRSSSARRRPGRSPQVVP